MNSSVKKLGSLFLMTSFVAGLQLVATSDFAFAEAKKKSCCSGKKKACNKKKGEDCDCKECQHHSEKTKKGD